MQAESSRKKYVVDGKGRRESIVLPVRDYEQLLEDLHDLAVVAERKREGRVDLAEMKRRLRKRASV